MYNGFLSKCHFSDYMLEYLKTVDLHIRNAIDIVLYAPISIYTKLDELRLIRENMPESTDDYWREYLDNAILNLEMGIDFLSADGVFSVEVCKYNEYEKDTTSYFDKICATTDDVWDFVRSDLEYQMPEEDDRIWYCVTKWLKKTDNKYIEACEYIFLKDEIIFSSLGEDIKEVDYVDKVNICDAQHLNIPVPFKPGDILEFDGYPFGPKCHVLILEIGDNRDCCCVQGLWRNENGEWDYGAIKHGDAPHYYYPKLSDLYAAKPFEGELDENEKIMYEISGYLNGNEDRGRKFWNTLYMRDSKADRENYCDGILEEQLKKDIEVFLGELED